MLHQKKKKKTKRRITPAFAKKLRIAKAKADIDRMLSGPDPPFDLQTELEKVVSMNPPPPPATTETTMMSICGNGNNRMLTAVIM
jgi:hypothetical protein